MVKVKKQSQNLIPANRSLGKKKIEFKLAGFKLCNKCKLKTFQYWKCFLYLHYASISYFKRWIQYVTDLTVLQMYIYSIYTHKITILSRKKAAIKDLFFVYLIKGTLKSVRFSKRFLDEGTTCFSLIQRFNQIFIF